MEPQTYQLLPISSKRPGYESIPWLRGNRLSTSGFIPFRKLQHMSGGISPTELQNASASLTEVCRETTLSICVYRSFWASASLPFDLPIPSVQVLLSATHVIWSFFKDTATAPDFFYSDLRTTSFSQDLTSVLARYVSSRLDPGRKITEEIKKSKARHVNSAV